MSNLAIFGGTFNPIHWGHLLIAETAIDQFQLDRVIWVPTFRSPHKTQSLLAFEHRLEMVQRAIADHPAFTVSAMEGQRQSVSYAIDTLNALQALEPNANWYWIIGNDAFQSLPKWRAHQALMAQCSWLVAPRALQNDRMRWSHDEGEQRGEGDHEEANASNIDCQASRLQPLSAFHRPSRSATKPHWHQLQTPLIDISSTLIRQRCQQGRSIRYLVPETVRRYITGQNLYRMS
jgi:nicotinate-nucleotide adenylyltransferase